jgi:hypothetical protein
MPTVKGGHGATKRIDSHDVTVYEVTLAGGQDVGIWGSSSTVGLALEEICSKSWRKGIVSGQIDLTTARCGRIITILANPPYKWLL